MTDKQFIEILRKIREHCLNTSCSKCPFEEPHDCKFRVIARSLNSTPIGWDLTEIEELINE